MVCEIVIFLLCNNFSHGFNFRLSSGVIEVSGMQRALVSDYYCRDHQRQCLIQHFIAVKDQQPGVPENVETNQHNDKSTYNIWSSHICLLLQICFMWISSKIIRHQWWMIKDQQLGWNQSAPASHESKSAWQLFFKCSRSPLSHTIPNYTHTECLFYTIPYYTILYWTVQYYTTQIILYYTITYVYTQFHIILYYTIWNYTMPYQTIY